MADDYIEKGSPSERRADPQEQPPTLQPLDISVDDTRLLNYLNALEKAATTHWNEAGPKGLNIKERRKQNIRYLFGRQLLGRDLKEYESEFLDNVIYEFEAMLKSLATSKMPDIIFESGGSKTDEYKKKTMELLTKVNENKMLDRKFRKSLGILFKHLPAYFIAVFKYRWDPIKNKIGDIVEEPINPDNIVLDHTAISADPDEMSFIIHYVEKTGMEWVSLFPKKEDEIVKYIESKHKDLAGDAKKKDWMLAQKVKVAEFWFDWLNKANNYDKENPAFEKLVGVAWKLGDDAVLGKMKNPNWDYEGHQVAKINGEVVDPMMLEQAMMMGQPIETETVYNNYFEHPKKPFILMSFDQFLRSALDETSRIEQAIPLQKSSDQVERSMDHMISSHKGKHVWSTDSGMTKKDLKKLDMDNPNMDVIIAGDPSKVHSFIQAVMPTPETFVHVRDRRDRMFAKVGTHGATRGEVTTQVATTNQIAREADFTRSDDLVDETILHVTTEIAQARLHMMKLRYTPEHWKRLLGKVGGDFVELRLDNDSIDDGIEVKVTASTTDKLRAERNAQGMAQLNFTDPLSYYEDMHIPNPEERAERLFLKDTNPELYYQKFILKKDITALANQVVASSTTNMMGSAPGRAGGVPPVASAPMVPSPAQAGNPAVTPPAQPQGSPRGLMDNMMGGIRKMMGR